MRQSSRFVQIFNVDSEIDGFDRASLSAVPVQVHPKDLSFVFIIDEKNSVRSGNPDNSRGIELAIIESRHTIEHLPSAGRLLLQDKTKNTA
jgi:hypothetical protein